MPRGSDRLRVSMEDHFDPPFGGQKEPGCLRALNPSNWSLWVVSFRCAIFLDVALPAGHGGRLAGRLHRQGVSGSNSLKELPQSSSSRFARLGFTVFPSSWTGPGWQNKAKTRFDLDQSTSIGSEFASHAGTGTPKATPSISCPATLAVLAPSAKSPCLPGRKKQQKTPGCSLKIGHLTISTGRGFHQLCAAGTQLLLYQTVGSCYRGAFQDGGIWELSVLERGGIRGERSGCSQSKTPVTCERQSAQQHENNETKHPK